MHQLGSEATNKLTRTNALSRQNHENITKHLNICQAFTKNKNKTQGAAKTTSAQILNKAGNR